MKSNANAYSTRNNEYLTRKDPEQPSVSNMISSPTYTEEIQRIDEEIQDMERLIVQKEKECEILYLFQLMHVIRGVLSQNQYLQDI
uniref:Uncharacterized protein n=1 Tax=Drosophila melanogaster TaxID=7227 RepID=E1JJR5_DROME|nr:uncharacterized protein Dmel_CG42581 [Drosophila melanogaster]ACZ95334.1 uncharacterized protein Dmel_CG42581 [Drosophila melanogaster]|eukprot:NP_001162800.1 uncharacterized protein Dmel_CG42581 [Drosophila melanogaster]